MDSKRKQFYKKYTNKNVAKGLRVNQRSSKRKRNNSPMQSDTKFVSKLRRANTADYKSTGLPSLLHTGNHRPGFDDSLQSKPEQVDLRLDVEEPENSKPIQLNPLHNKSYTGTLGTPPVCLETYRLRNPPPTQLHPLFNVSCDPENLWNLPSMQLDSSIDENFRTPNIDNTQSMELDLLSKVVLHRNGTDNTVPKDPDATVDRTLIPANLKDTSMDSDPLVSDNFDLENLKHTSSIDSETSKDANFGTVNLNDTSITDLYQSTDENLKVTQLQTSKDENFGTTNLKDTSIIYTDQPAAADFRLANPKIIQSIDSNTVATENIHTISLKRLHSQQKEPKNALKMNSDPAADENRCTTDLNNLSPIDTTPPSITPPVHETSHTVNLEDTSTVQSQFHNILTIEADIHDLPSISAQTYKENVENKTLSRRNEEIEICLRDIREENDVKDKITEGGEVNNSFIIEFELEEDEVGNEDKSTKAKIDTNKKENEKINKDNNIIKYQYIDFLSDDEPFMWSSSSWDDSEKDSETDDVSGPKKHKKKQSKKKPGKKIKKKNTIITTTEQRNETSLEENNNDSRKKTKRTNISKERSRLRNSGQEYITKTGNTIEAKRVKANPCQPDKCPNECYNVPEDKRCDIFNHYWALSKERRSDWIVSHSKREKVKRKRTKDFDSRRQWSHSYFINDGEGQKKVCLKFLLNTLDIRQRFVHSIIESSMHGCAKDDSRGKHVPANKTPDAIIESVRSYIQNLPAVPSHYCRKNTKKCYLPQNFKNVTNLYKIYKETKQSEGAAFVGEKVFKKIFNTEYNISFHIPRKDKCMKCIKYENNQSEEFKVEKEIHMKDKEDTYARFKIHQQANKQDSSVLCVTFDLQKVLNTPYGQSMLLYYSRKLAVYNLTFYESWTREGFCYTWNETTGKRGANEICTILSKYIEKVDARGTVKHLLLYCDSCPGQNKNRIVLACLHQILQKCTSINSIQINYLLPGHTYMPVDSMHAIIEKSVANSIIWAPSQWATVFSLARKSPKPYEVKTLTHKDFEGWDKVTDKYFKGNLVGKISKIRTATFRKSNLDKMNVKYSMAADAEYEIIEISAIKELTPKKIYKSQLPISKKKYADLLKLCTNQTIPEMCQNEFIGLPNAANVQDLLPESDIEDEELDVE